MNQPNQIMTDKTNEQLRTIARELRELAAIAYGNPSSVKVTAGTLFKYAETLERIAPKLKPTLQPYAGNPQPYAGKSKHYGG